MQRGINMEPKAREAFEELTSIVMNPACFQHDDYEFIKCSVDGIDFTGNEILEIKCPGEHPHNQAISGEVPDHYFLQMQHCMYVTGASRCHFFSYRPECSVPYAHIIVERDDVIILDLLKSEIEFWHHVTTDNPPETEKSDFVISDDFEAVSVAEKYKARQAAYNKAKALLDEAKQELLDHTDGGNCIIGSLKCTLVEKKGSVDYSNLIKSLSVDDATVESFRKPSSSYWKISEIK